MAHSHAAHSPLPLEGEMPAKPAEGGAAEASPYVLSTR
jgi:hypothetical protein